MEKFQEFRDAANKKLKVADYILTMTYPLVKDPKLLLSSVENILLAYSYSMGSLLHCERLFKRIPPFHENFSGRLEMFRSRCMDRHNFDPEHIRIMNEMREIILLHKKSPMEFSRNNNLVICDGSYKMKIVSLSMVKSYLEKAKLYISKASSIVGRDESIFR